MIGRAPLKSLLAAGIVAASLGAGCLSGIEPIDPKVGPPDQAICSNQDSDPGHDVSFSNQILPVLTGAAKPIPGCKCHQPTDPNPIGFEQTGLDLSSWDGIQAGGNNSKGKTIVAGAPCDSIIWQKISPGPPFGSRMPLSGPPFLDDATRQLIADWIAEGALDN
jgi:hypothetical protein